MSHSRTLTAAGRRTTEDLPVKPCNRKKKEAGSALLVVLGFLSFMVVSAVAFAIYMRAERVPSSALRRNVATRHLVKAALAQAMSRVDDAIRADQFPGLANIKDLSNCYHDKEENAMDVWYGRVFMPPNPAGLVDDGGGTVRQANDPIDDKDKFAWRFAPVTETVSVLNLEALGYIPPPLVNDVRFLSRSTWTAKWQNFAYDAGRFAFCAVNVSDYFDVNRVTAGVRTSSPDSRISLSYLLRDDEEALDSISSAAAKTFTDSFGPKATMRQTYSNPDGGGGSVPNTVPYISMLDYNLALGEIGQESGIGGQIRSFFWQWIKNPKRYFYGNGASREDGEIQQASRQPFVADSWNVDIANDTTGTNIVLHGEPDGQPFRAETGIWRKSHDKVTMTDALSALNQDWNGGKPVELKFEPCDWMTLFDYLDGNDYPLSLAFPCVERVPMVAALQPALTVKLEMEAQAPRTEAGTNPKERYQVTDYKLKDDILSGTLATLIAFPFRHGKDFPKSGYSAQAFVRMVLAPAGVVSLRSGADGMKQLRPTAEEWDGDLPPAFQTKGGLSGAFVLTARSAEQPFQLPEVTDENSMVRDDVAFDIPRRAADGIVFSSRVKQVNKGTEEGENWVSSGDPPEFNIPIDVFGPEGNLMGLPKRGDNGWMKQTELEGIGELVPYVFAWVRIMKGDDAVDYVPAHYDDDMEMLGVATSGDPVAEEVGGRMADYPFFRWRVDANKFTYSATPTPYTCGVGDWLPKTYFTVDPRFNWAPEDWISSDTLSISKDNWLNFVDSALGKNGRDSDPFLFVSNQGYLQSIGELAFLPRLSDLHGTSIGVHVNKVANGGYDGIPRTAVEGIANAECVWTGFRPYNMEGGVSDRLFDLGVSDGAGSVAVNPYTDNESIRLAAFANTPYDWWAAGTNSTTGLFGSDATQEYFNRKNYVKSDDVKTSLDYAFTDGNGTAKLEYKDVAKIANAICESIREKPDIPWEQVYDSLDWYGIGNSDPKDFMGVTLDHPLYSDDRKFLYAYWRNCFANKQQLFLIFVRAESTSLGGPGEGTPAQQGGRAVALVWREPQSNVVSGGPNGATDDKQTDYKLDRRPHRMRVLFYHQFD